jgi:hypothetical protein
MSKFAYTEFTGLGELKFTCFKFAIEKLYGGQFLEDEIRRRDAICIILF